MTRNFSKTGACGLAAIGLLAAPTMMIVTGCSTQDAVAATVNGENIYEQTITDYIQNMRETNDLTDDNTWAQWLVDNGYDVDSIRDNAIDYYVKQKVIEQDAKKHDIEVSDDDVNSQLDEIKGYYSYSDDDFKSALKSAGYTEDSYKEYVKSSMLQEKLMNAVITDVDPTDEDLINQANNYKSIINGSKNLKVIALDKNDKSKADDVDKQAKASGSNFDQIASDNTASSEYDGWDVMVSVDSKVSEAVKNMNKGDISDVIEGTDYYFIVKVVDVCTVPDEGFTSVDQIPESYKDTFKDSLTTSKKSSEFQTYTTNLENDADKTTNPRPDKLPYDVSLDGVQPSENSTAAANNASSSNDVSVDGDTVTSDDGSTTVTTTDAGTSNVSSTDSSSSTSNDGSASNAQNAQQ